MNRAVFLDRDGTLVVDTSFLENIELLPGAAEAVRLLNKNDFLTIVVTNQPGVDESTISKINFKIQRDLQHKGAYLDEIYFCPHQRDGGCECRKPKPGLVLRAMEKYDIDLNRSFVIGDRLCDIELGKNIGARTILVGSSARKKGEIPGPTFESSNILEAVKVILKVTRRGKGG